MIIAQGWKNNKVHVISLARADNGMDAWQVYKGVYDPKSGGTFETATWECMNSSHNITMLLYDVAMGEIASWVDGDKQAKDIHTVLAELKTMCQQITMYVEAAVRK